MTELDLDRLSQKSDPGAKVLSDAYLPNPPEDCLGRDIVWNGQKVQDLVICSKCRIPCDEYFNHETPYMKLIKDRRRKPKAGEEVTDEQ